MIVIIKYRIYPLIIHVLAVSHYTAQEVPSYLQIELSHVPKAIVLRVFDGDMVVVLLENKEEIVHMIGVKNPETVHPTKPVEPYGKEASLFTKNHLLSEEVWLIFDNGIRSQDVFGRDLSYLFRDPDGLFVNLEIVWQGYSPTYIDFLFEYMGLFRSYEVKAQEAKRGLWGEENNLGSSPYQLSKSMILIPLKQAKQSYGACSVRKPNQ